MAASSRTQVLSLYRMLMKESKKFPSYNYRTYALRRIRDAFRENQNVNDPKTLEVLLSQAWDNLALIQRQLAVSHRQTLLQTHFSVVGGGAHASFTGQHVMLQLEARTSPPPPIPPTAIATPQVAWAGWQRHAIAF
ncbi:hypothetical protein AAFF_G00002200 [Aldrovandia affinis]|uniref:Complex 1 LYR protein domain-containing protein n=1 Tax=Aldrovandia affinis TaxID=143900 RepID=A0AAD7X2H7_9TELE|nr:hypothetical protein AAFF_G00002200 [Aldrovandia affinis]